MPVVNNNPEMENKFIRRDCLANIIDILQKSSGAEKKHQAKRIKEELELNMICTPSNVIKKLKATLKRMDKEMKALNCLTKISQNLEEEQKIKIKKCHVKLNKVPMKYLMSLTNQTKDPMKDTMKTVMKSASKKAKTAMKKLHVQNKKENRKDRIEKMKQTKAMKNALVEEEQMAKLLSLELPKEEEASAAVYSKYHFLENLGLIMNVC